MVVSFISNNAATVTQHNLQKSEVELTRTLNRISTGSRVFSASEDATSMAIGIGLRADVAAMRAAQINTAQAVSMMQIADGALGEMSSVIVRLSSLASTAQSGHLSNIERNYLDLEYQRLLQEIDRIAGSTEFNGQPLLGGRTNVLLNNIDPGLLPAAGYSSFEFDSSRVSDLDQFEVEYYAATGLMQLRNVTTGVVQSLPVQQPAPGFQNTYSFGQLGVTLTLNYSFDPAVDVGPLPFDVMADTVPVASVLEFQIGPSTSANDRLSVALPMVNTAALGIAATDITTEGAAASAFQFLEEANRILNAARADVGASMSRVETAAANLSISIENAEAARSSLLDANVAEEASNLAANQVLFEAGTAILAQANMRPKLLLRILNEG